MNTTNTPETEGLLPANIAGSDNIFEALKESSQNDGSQPKNPLRYFRILEKVARIFAQITIVIFLLLSLDSFLRLSSGSNFLSGLAPLCPYYLLGVEDTLGYTEKCLSLTDTSLQLENDITTEKKLIVANVSKFAPLKLQITNILALPEVKFIQSKTGPNRKIITEMVEKVNSLTDRVSSQGSYLVRCIQLSLDESGNISMNCVSYGSQLLNGSKVSSTSRIGITAFLDLLNQDDTLKIIEYPKTLELTEASADRVDSRFSTATQMQIKLQYTPIN